MSFDVPTDISRRPVTVVGAGTLGRRIALMFAAHGAEARIYDLSAEQRRAAVDYVIASLPALEDRINGLVPGNVSSDSDLAEAVRNTQPRSRTTRYVSQSSTRTNAVINGDAPISARRNAWARNRYSRRRPRARFLANVNCNVL
jgi:NAD(P)-dependent dehydrogenase (short-subunit alcohol dehydrogenase family)